MRYGNSGHWLCKPNAIPESQAQKTENILHFITNMYLSLSCLFDLFSCSFFLSLSFSRSSSLRVRIKFKNVITISCCLHISHSNCSNIYLICLPHAKIQIRARKCAHLLKKNILQYGCGLWMFVCHQIL